MFPLTIEFSRTLNKRIEENELAKVLDLISKTVVDRKGNIIYIGQQELIYKGSDSAWRQNIFKSVNKGIFKIQCDDKITIKYTIYLTTIVLVGVIAGLILGVVTQHYQVGLFTLLWAGGVNWTITAIRHSSLLNDIVIKINQT